MIGYTNTQSQSRQEATLLAWAKECGLNPDAFAQGMEAAALFLTLSPAGLSSVVGPLRLHPPLPPGLARSPPPARKAERRRRAAFVAGFCRALDLAVLAAADTAVRFAQFPAPADGTCLFGAVVGRPTALRDRTIEALARDWDVPCSAPGRAGRTVGQALHLEHGLPPGAAVYVAFTRLRDKDGQVPQRGSALHTV